MTRSGIAILTLAASSVALAQTQPPAYPPPPPQQQQQQTAGGWRRVGDPPPQQYPQQPAPVAQGQDPTEPVDRTDAYGQVQQNQQGPPPPPPGEFDQQPGGPPPRMQSQRRPAYGLPPEVVVRPGTFVTILTNQPLSSDHNQPGDTFSGTLAQPLVVDGIVVANRGQAVYGRVAEAVKAHAGNSSRLGIELTSLSLADGTQVNVHTQLVARQGTTTPAGDQVGTVAATTAVGAVIGAAADYGRGAGVGIGAGAGAAAGIIGVLLTRNHPTVVYPETPLTFRMEQAVPVDLARAPQAYRYVGPEEYNHPVQTQLAPRPMVRPAPYYGPGYYGPYGYPYAYGPSIYLGWGPGYFYGRGYGFGRRWR